MSTHRIRRVGLALGGIIWLASTGAAAQAPGPIAPAPEPLPAVEPAPPEPVEPAPAVEPEPVAAPAAQPAPAPVVEDADEGPSDHEAMVGRTAVGYLGLAAVPVGDDSVTAPVIGIRHWMSRGAGLDLGIGFGFQRTSQTTLVEGIPDIEGPRTLAVGVAAHAGLPLAFFYRRHYAFLLVPEVNVGFGTATIDPDPDFDDDETKLRGLLFEGGARIGSEIHFGFMGIPELSLQASVGAYARYTWTQEEDVGTMLRDRADSLTIGTTVQGDPWDIFAGSITALYYF